MSNQTNSKSYATELFIEDLGRVTGGTFTTSGAEGGSHTTWSLAGIEEGGGANPSTTHAFGEGGSSPITQMVGEGGGLPGLPSLPNFPGLPITQMTGEGGNVPAGKL
jgi:hypothetical protein